MGNSGLPLGTRQVEASALLSPKESVGEVLVTAGVFCWGEGFLVMVVRDNSCGVAVAFAAWRMVALRSFTRGDSANRDTL